MMRGAGGRNKEFQKPPSERQKKVRQQKRHLSAVKGRAFIQDVVNGQEKAGFSNRTVNEGKGEIVSESTAPYGREKQECSG